MIPTPPDRKLYLGDGVYAELDKHGDITLSTEREEGAHFIVLDRGVLLTFLDWLKAHNML